MLSSKIFQALFNPDTTCIPRGQGFTLVACPCRYFARLCQATAGMPDVFAAVSMGVTVSKDQGRIG